jgi:glycosyltransferase involved in cell wall biosynthesis
VQIYLTNASFKSKFLNGLKRWKKYENDCLNRVEHIIVVVDEAKERVINDYGISESKVTIVSNTEDVDFFENLKLDPNLIDSYKDYFVITYVGGFGPHRGLDVPVKAMPILKEKIPNVRLLLVGEGGNRAELERLASDLGVSQSVEFTGWQHFDLMPSYISLSDICLVPHHSNPHTDSTIPHKIFQYMLMGKPVVVSTCKPLARIVNETQAGLVFESGNSDDFARVCLELLDADKRKQFGENGRQAVLTKYNWENTGEDLIKVYENIRNTR